MDDCIFCKIITGKIPSSIIHRDDRVVAFKDIQPMAPVHILIIPVEHITSLTDITEKGAGLIGHLVVVANKIARGQNIAEKGYRVVINAGKEGGQVVQHLHMHLLGGRELSGRLG